MSNNSYIIELERLRADLRDRIRARFISCTNDEPLDTLIPKVSNIGYWNIDDKTTPAYIGTGENETGLVALYDGIKNTRSGHEEGVLQGWEDLSGNNNDLSVMSVPALYFADNGVIAFKNIADCGLLYAALSDSSIVTVECVFQQLDFANSYGSIAGFAKTKNKMLVVEEYGNSILYKSGGNCYALDRTKVNSVCVDYTADTILINGESSETTGHTDTFSSNPNNDINLFRYGSSIATGFGGIIHSVRIYNRSLTAEEKAHNLAIDATRFGVATD